MAKKLKIWNGRGHGHEYGKGSFYVAAYSIKQATELLIKAAGSHISGNEVKVYYNPGTWGNSMNGIQPTEPCVYGIKRYGEKPVRLI